MKNAFNPKVKGFHPWKGWQKEKDAKRKLTGKMKISQERKKEGGK